MADGHRGGITTEANTNRYYIAPVEVIYLSGGTNLFIIQSSSFKVIGSAVQAGVELQLLGYDIM